MEKVAIFAGTFDPFTLGHYEIVVRALKNFDKIIVAIADDSNRKSCRFNANARKEIAIKSLEGINGVEVEIFEGLLVDYMKKKGVNTLVRGIRNTIDFEYEKTLFNAYKTQLDKIEGFYLICSSEYEYLSSSLVREVLSFGGSVEQYICKNALPLIK